MVVFIGDMRKTYFRFCESCNKKLTYSSRQNFYRARKGNGLCRTCNAKGNKWSNQKRSIFTKEKMRNKKIGIPRSESFKEHMRIKALQRVIRLRGSPSYNPSACQFIDDLNKKNGWNLQHALNGGEVIISGYSMDGYDRDRKIVFEYDEPHHHFTTCKNKDIIRQQRIIELLKPNLFIRYDEKNGILYNVNV